MPDTNSFNDRARALKDEASAKLEELEKEAGKLGDQIKDKASALFEKASTTDIQEEINHLKKEASEKLDELTDAAKGLWNKITGHPGDATKK